MGPFNSRHLYHGDIVDLLFGIESPIRIDSRLEHYDPTGIVNKQSQILKK